jgi:hypothetical protein
VEYWLIDGYRFIFRILKMGLPITHSPIIPKPIIPVFQYSNIPFLSEED